VSRRLVRALTRSQGLKAWQPRPWRATTLPGDQPPAVPDRLGRDFTAATPEGARSRVSWGCRSRPVSSTPPRTTRSLEHVADAPVISAYDVSKRFVTHRARATSWKERLVRRQGRIEHGEFWALRGLSLEIAQGETVGLIGHNGSGKSTTLKLLAGIVQPTTGTVHTLGRVASLLELGAGFAAELTGRDNVFLNASLLGLSRSETAALFDQILEFSELGERIDDPVKVYSSGMYVKLGFAIAVHVDPDILLIDEVLAVGDEAFQAKCIAKIEQFQQAGKTILVVTHGLDQVPDLCTRAVVLDHGRVQYDGEPAVAVARMRRLIGTAREEPKAEPLPEPQPETFAIGGVTLSHHPDGEARPLFFPGEPVTFRVEVEVLPAAGAAGEVSAVLMAEGNFPVFVMHGGGAGSVPAQPGSWSVDFRVDAVPPLLGFFDLAVSVTDTASGRAVAARVFPRALHVPGDSALGLLDCPSRVSVSRPPATPDLDPVATA